MLRPGKVHSAEDWDELLLPEIECQQAASQRTRVAEGGRATGVAKKPYAVTGTARSDSIRRPERRRKEYRTWYHQNHSSQS